MYYKVSKFLTLIFFLLFSTPLFAQLSGGGLPEPQSFTFYREFNEPANCTTTTGGGGQLAKAGKIKTFFTKYDRVGQMLLLDILFEPCDVNGALANAFQFVMNAGPSPKGHPGELAMFYVDFRDAITSRGRTSPIVTAYGYNGRTEDTYKDGITDVDTNGNPGVPGDQVPDRIISSIIDPNFILDYQVIDTPAPPPLQSANKPFVPDHRRFILKISTETINSHTPLWPKVGVDWFGTGFNRLIGNWFHLIQLNDQTSYCDLATATVDAFPCANIPNGAPANAADGFLENWSYDYLGWYDSANETANGAPTCLVGVRPQPFNQQLGCYEVELNEVINAQYIFSDFEGDDFKVEYINNSLPASATVSPAGPVEAFTGSGQIDISWTPTVTEQSGMFSLDVMFTDDAHAMGSCGAKFCVVSNAPPVCDVQLTGSNPNQCDGVITKVDFSGTGSSDPDSDPLTYTWDTDCPGDLEFSPGVQNPKEGALSLTAPGEGNGVDNCSIFLTVSDPYYPAETCSIPVQVDPCSLDCLNNPNGSAQLDECGVCNGDNSTCSDCEGTPNGTATFDICGVCNGDGTACADCAGDAHGGQALDQCGVCGGNGLSCVECENLDISGFQQAVDSRVTDLERTVRQEIIARTVRFKDVFKRGKKAKAKTRQKAREDKVIARNFRETAWVDVFTPDSVVTTCSDNAQAVCVEVNNTVALQNAKVSTKQLLDHGQDLVLELRIAARKAFIKRGRPKKKARKKANRLANKVLTKIEGFHNEALASLDEIPNTSTNCN